MGLDQEWQKKVVENLQPEEGQKEEKEYLPSTSSRMIEFKSLNQSSAFLKILKKKKLHTKYFTIFFDKNISKPSKKKYLNISFVMKKKIGNAVIRNKIKRKLKYAVQKIVIEKDNVDLNYTYVVFGKNNVYKDKFALIFKEINNAFKKIKQVQLHETN